MSSHQISEVERVADTIAILHEGKLRLVAPLVELKGSIVEVSVGMEDPLIVLPVLPCPADVLTEETYGRLRRIVVCHYDSEMHDALTAHDGVTSVRERSLSLEEIFIACTKGSLAHEPSSGIEL